MDLHAFVDAVVSWIGQHPDLLALAIFLIAFLESLVIVGIFIPGVIFLFALAALSGSGALSLTFTLLAAFLGAVAGDGLSFYLGRRYSSQSRSIWPLSRYPDLIRQSERFFHDHGGKSVVIGRFVGPLRCFLPLVAGALGMSPVRFVSFNIASAIAWAPWYILPGFLVGAAIDVDTPLPPHFYPVLAGLLVTILALSGLFSQLHWHLRPAGPFYSWVESIAANSASLAYIWRNAYSERQGQKEYPVSSIILFLLGSLGFAMVTLLTLYLPAVSALNHWTSELMKTLHIPLLDIIFVNLTLLGDPGFLYLIFGGFILLLLSQRRFSLAIFSLSGGLLTHGMTSLIKTSLAIERPDSALLPASFSYPSGHTSGAVFVYGIITTFIAREVPAQKRWPIYIAGAIWTLLIASSRLYLEVHWFSDVLGGIMLGLTLCGLVRVAQSPYDRQPVLTGRWLLALLLGASLLAALYLSLQAPGALAEYRLNTQPAMG